MTDPDEEKVAMLSRCYDPLSIGVLVADENLNLVFTNTWLRERLPPDPAEHRNLAGLLTGKKLTLLASMIRATIRKGAHHTLSHTFHGWILPLPDPRMDDGRMAQSCVLSPCFLGRRGHAMLQIRDESDAVLRFRSLQQNQEKLIESNDKLTLYNQELKEEVLKRKQVEEALIRERNKAEAASRAKSMHLANMSHEIRTPLNAVQGFSELLRTMQFGALNTNQLEFVDNIVEGCGQIQFLIGDILDLTRVEAGRIEISNTMFRMEEVMDGARRALAKLAAEKGLAYRIRVDPSIPQSLMGDSFRIGQILRNLVGNAIKFTSKGEIVVEVKMHSESELLFTVQDTGIGVPGDRLEKIFNNYYQMDSSLSKKYGGAGLGLAISRELVELMGGRIWVESEVGKGSAFHFTVRIAAPGDAAGALRREEPVGEKSGESRRSLKILLAEDDRLSMKTTSFHLKREGHVITRAANGREVLDALEADDFDIILMDIQMPGMDGLEATRLIRRSTSGKFDAATPIIALTAYAMKGDKEKFMEAGMNDYVPKPVDFDMLSEKIAQLCGR